MAASATGESNPDGSPPRKKWMFRVVAAGLPTLVGGALLLLLLIQQDRLVRDPKTGRWRFQQPPIYIQEEGHERTGHKYIYDPRLGWRNIPGWSATTNGKPLTINSQGLRGREYPYEKPPGRKRILVLGDSYIWGYGVADDELLTESLAAKLSSAEQRWEVLNTGVSGWGTDQEYLFLIDEGFKYSPDIVLLSLFIVNDPVNNLYAKQYGIWKPVFLNANLELANVPVPKPGRHTPLAGPYADPMDLVCAILHRMLQACRERGAKLVVMKFGEFLAPDRPDYQELTKRIESLAEASSDTYFLDLDLAYLARGITQPQLLDGNDDGHWNAFGHDVSADILFEFLLRKNLIGPLGDPDR
jgi:hypothetical protein